jgi:hypothetical protein
MAWHLIIKHRDKFTLPITFSLVNYIIIIIIIIIIFTYEANQGLFHF